MPGLLSGLTSLRNSSPTTPILDNDRLFRESSPATATDIRPKRDTYQHAKWLKTSSEGEVGVVRSDTSQKLLVVKHTKRKEVANLDGSGTVYLSPGGARILLRTLSSHSNIIRLFGTEPSHEPGRYLLFMEFGNGGDLSDQLRRFLKLQPRDYDRYPVVRRANRECLVPEVFLLYVFVSLADALAYIHHGLRRNSRGAYERDARHEAVIHADIKPENILLRWHAHASPSHGLRDIVLADFGAAQLAAASRRIAGTAGFDSPGSSQDLES